MNVNLSPVPKAEQAVYQPLHCGALPAKVLAQRPDGTADLQVFNSNGTTMMMLTRIKLRPKDRCGRGEAYLGSLVG